MRVLAGRVRLRMAVTMQHDCPKDALLHSVSARETVFLLEDAEDYVRVVRAAFPQALLRLAPYGRQYSRPEIRFAETIAEGLAAAGRGWYRTVIYIPRPGWRPELCQSDDGRERYWGFTHPPGPTVDIGWARPVPAGVEDEVARPAYVADNRVHVAYAGTCPDERRIKDKLIRLVAKVTEGRGAPVKADLSERVNVGPGPWLGRHALAWFRAEPNRLLGLHNSWLGPWGWVPADVADARFGPAPPG